MSEQGTSRPATTSPLSGQRCLITGASGFIGGRLAARLAGHGAFLRCLVRAGSDTSAISSLGVEAVVGDLRDRRSLEPAAEGCRYVFHCAALVTDWATKREIVETNVHGTRNLLAASRRANVERFVHLSTTDVYAHPGGSAIEESHAPRRFANWYAQTKREAEAALLLHAGGRHGIEAVILRPATVYGPGSVEVIGEIARAIGGGRMLLIDRGRALAGLCYVENLIDLAVIAAIHDDAPGSAFNVTDGLSVTWRQFTDDLAAGLGRPSPRLSMPYWLALAVGYAMEQGYRGLRRATGLRSAPLLSRQAVQVLGRNQDFSARRARELLGWAPRVGYPEGLRATLAWLQDRDA